MICFQSKRKAHDLQMESLVLNQMEKYSGFYLQISVVINNARIKEMLDECKTKWDW